MGRLDTRMHPPPVRIARANARALQAELLLEAQRTATGAGDYGARERRFASVPLKLTIQKHAGPNTPSAQAAVIPIGFTRRKRGYPPITTLPTG
jgi:hypothetical protein